MLRKDALHIGTALTITNTLWVYRFANTIFTKNGKHITGYSVFEFNKTYSILTYRKWECQNQV